MFESFDVKSKTTSAYILVFELSTKQIIFTEFISSFDDFAHNNLAVWTPGCYFAAVKLSKRLSWDKEKGMKKLKE